MSDTVRQIRAARDGDRYALAELYDRHQGRLLGFVRSRIDPALARRVAPEDLVQETLLEATRKIAEFDPVAGPAFYRWLVEIARFKLREAARAQQAGKRAAERPMEESVRAVQTSPSGRAMRGERALQLHEALATLPERQAEAVRLRYLEGRSVAETAEILESTEAAVKSLVSRGMQELAGRVDRLE